MRLPTIGWTRKIRQAEAKIATAKGKKNHDKRATEAKRDWGRQKQRLLRHGD